MPRAAKTTTPDRRRPSAGASSYSIKPVRRHVEMAAPAAHACRVGGEGLMARIRRMFAAAACRAAGAFGTGRGAGLSEPAGAADRAVPARRHQRHRRPRDRASISATGWASRSSSTTAAAPAASSAARFVANAPKDGHTLLIVSLASAVNPWLYKLPYDPVKSFAPVAMLVAAPNVVTVNPGLPVEQHQGTRRARQVEARRPAIRVVRRRHVPASGRRAVQDHRRRRHPAHPVPRRGPGADRRGRRPHQDRRSAR